MLEASSKCSLGVSKRVWDNFSKVYVSPPAGGTSGRFSFFGMVDNRCVRRPSVIQFTGLATECCFMFEGSLNSCLSWDLKAVNIILFFQGACPRRALLVECPTIKGARTVEF